MGEPRIETTYEDKRQSSAAVSDDHVLSLIGIASDGLMDDFQSFAGMSGLASAEDLFGTTGRLPHAIREAIDVSVQRKKPVTVNAMRCGEGANKALFAIYDDTTSVIVMALEYDYEGVDGNDWAAKLELDGLNGVLSLRRGDGTTTQFEGATGQAIVDAVNAGSLPIIAVAGPGIATSLANILLFDWTNFFGGLDGTLTNAEVIRVLAIAEAESFPNVIVLGANSAATRSAIATHCANQLSEYQVERYAFIELAGFDSTNAINSAAWRLDVDGWVGGIETDVTGDDDWNLSAFAGDAVFLDADGAEYQAPVLVACAAALLGEAIHRSGVGLQLPTVQRLVPEIPPEYRNLLVAARVNYARFEDGIGYIVAHDHTLAGETSDFKWVNGVRTAYTCGKEFRNGAKPYLGGSNDPITNDGLTNIQRGGDKALTRRKDLGNISDFTTTLSIDGEGVVSADMAIQEMAAMRWINHTVSFSQEG